MVGSAGYALIAVSATAGLAVVGFMLAVYGAHCFLTVVIDSGCGIDEIRWPSELELKATSVLKLPIEEASAKIRVGDPKDDEEDYAMDIWAGVLPLLMTPGEPIPDSRLKEGTSIPDHVSEYRG